MKVNGEHWHPCFRIGFHLSKTGATVYPMFWSQMAIKCCSLAHYSASARAGLPPLGAQGTQMVEGPLLGGLHRRRNQKLSWNANCHTTIETFGVLVARLQQNKLLVCERRRRERKFSPLKSRNAGVGQQFTHHYTYFWSWGPPNARGPGPVPCVPCGWSVTGLWPRA